MDTKLNKESKATIELMIAEGIITRENAEKYFPELKESEDERIKKIIKSTLQAYNKGVIVGSLNAEDYSDCIAWLEKQGEQKPVISDEAIREGVAHFGITQYQINNWLKKYIDVEKQCEHNPTLPVWKYKKDNTPLLRDSFILNKYGCVANSPSGSIVSDVWVLDFDALAKLPKEEFEKQGSQNIANSAKTCKDEPKFHEGEWVFIEEVKGYKNGPFQIKTVGSFGYDFDEYHTIPFAHEYVLSKWTIQDAKAGDVLAAQDSVFIFKHKDKTGLSLCKSYCEVIGNSGIGLGFEFSINGVYPATKEQCDKLEKAITDAGYMWDAEKKELKKIEHNPTWSEYDEKMFEFWNLYYEHKVGDMPNKDVVENLEKFRDWLKSLKERVQPRQEWSEEDEKEVAVLEAYIRSKDWSDRHVDRALGIVDELVKKLKSLKARCTWKPSDEQIKVFEHFVRSLGERGF